MLRTIVGVDVLTFRYINHLLCTVRKMYWLVGKTVVTFVQCCKITYHILEYFERVNN